MAFDKTAMQRFIGGEVTLYAYKTTDAEAAVIASGYMDAMADELSVGDIVLATVGVGGTIAAVQLAIATNDGTTVTTVVNT